MDGRGPRCRRGWVRNYDGAARPQAHRFDAIAGKVLLQLGRPSLSSEINRFILICFAAFEALLIVTTALFPRPSYSTFPPDDEIGMALNVALAAGMGACISLLWWNSKDRYVELCERGIIARGQSFARWGQIRRIGWADNAELKMTCKNRTIYVKIVSRQREAVESLLAAKLSSVRLREKQRPDSASIGNRAVFRAAMKPTIQLAADAGGDARLRDCRRRIRARCSGFHLSGWSALERDWLGPWRHSA